MNRTEVALIRCDTYDIKTVKEALRKGIELLGGLGKFAKPGEKIILKPNLLVPADPDSAVTTHPSVFAAAAEILKDYGADVLWGDSPAVGPASIAAKRCSILKQAKRISAVQADFSNAVTIRSLDGRENSGFRIARGITEADGLISLPKMKTHGLMKITGAFKNQFGCLPGFQKAQYHLRYVSRRDFARMLVELTQFIKPRLYILDGIVAMDGAGPRGGDPKKMNVLIISPDPVAADAVFAQLIKLPIKFVPVLVEAEKMELGLIDDTKIAILGNKLSELQDASFRVERKSVPEPVPTPFLRFARNLIIQKPRILPGKCTHCGTCIEVCPTNPKSVHFTSKFVATEPPVFDYKNCIRCYCCFEVCPEKAIELYAPIRKSLKRPLL